MKTAYAHCILEFEVPDDVDNWSAKQGLLETLSSIGITAGMAVVDFDYEESEDDRNDNQAHS